MRESMELNATAWTKGMMAERRIERLSYAGPPKGRYSLNCRSTNAFVRRAYP